MCVFGEKRLVPSSPEYSLLSLQMILNYQNMERSSFVSFLNIICWGMLSIFEILPRKKF